MKSVQLAGIVQGSEEIDAVNRVLTEQPYWHVSGKECRLLQEELAAYHGVKYCVVVNSGSSANLLALKSLNLPKGSKVLTSACGFPSILACIVQLGLTPVLVDYNVHTCNIDLDDVEQALIEHSDIKAMILAHTMGSPLNMERLCLLEDKYGVLLIEDACEALGAKFDGKLVGTFGKAGTVSFYSSHQISGFGGGGAILTDDEDIYTTAKSLRDWGKREVREGQICTKMDSEVDGIPYDQQYTYETIGYNMRFPDANCAYAREQLKRLDGFVEKRRENYLHMRDALAFENESLLFMTWPVGAEPAFFGFPLIVRTPTFRDSLVEHMESKGVHVRLFFAGNILRHKPYKDLEYLTIEKNRKIGFPNADYLMVNALFCGCWPGLSLEDMEYSESVIKEFFTLEWKKHNENQ